ncbi:MAG: YceI family protein [Bacteroidota bacterium]
MKKSLLFLFLIGLAPMYLQAQNLTTDVEGTNISFKIKNLGFNVDGTFSDFAVKANFDENNLSDSYFKGTAQIQSIDTGIKARDEHLQKADYFHSEQYPVIKLTSRELKKVAEGKYEFIGDLSIKGKTQTVNFPIALEKSENSLTVSGNFEINRLDFEVGESSWVLKKKVKVAIVYQGNFQ